MGYTLRIGNAELEFDKEYSSCSINASSLELDNAPAFGEPTDKLNERWPSYTSWHDAMQFLGLYELMFDKENFTGENYETCLIYEHPGTSVITEYHKKIIDSAYEEFYKKYPDAKAGYSPKAKDDIFGIDEEWPKENGYAVRLEWLKFWIDYALINFERPIFYNS